MLIVEDEERIASAVAEILKKNYYDVDIAFDGGSGLDCAMSSIYNVIILDIMLPVKDGLVVLSQLRSAGIMTPIILLTAKGGVGDRINGLDIGADDYLAKPFHMDELLARVRALTRRAPELRRDGIVKCGDVEFDSCALIVRSNSGSVELTTKEAQIFEFMIINRGRIVPKEAIILKVWGCDAEVEDNIVEKHISSLRKKLAPIRSKASIRTVWGSGYSYK
jgi:DNA-binding response OmpR family regulator